MSSGLLALAPFQALHPSSQSPQTQRVPQPSVPWLGALAHAGTSPPRMSFRDFMREFTRLEIDLYVHLYTNVTVLMTGAL